MDWLYEYYEWIRALHIISVIAWMAGMLYLPRLYVYHCDLEPGLPASEMLKVMERRLLRGIINPAMIGTVILGALLLLAPGVVDWSAGWIWVKLAMVIAMLWLQGVYSRWRRAFEEDRRQHRALVYRTANEGPTVLMVIIVIMVAIKPF